MRIVFDCRYTRIDQPDGISRFTSGLVAALAALHPVVMLISDHRQLRHLPDLPWELACSPTSWREPFVARRVNRLQPDVVFSPMQTMGSWGRRYSLVLTVHDLIYYRHRTPPRFLPAPVRAMWRLYHLAWWPQRWLLNRADAIATVSQTTASLIEQHRLTRRPVVVVPNAADHASSGAPERTVADTSGLSERKRQLVYMGSFMPYKNVDALVRAAALLPNYELHLMSRIDASERERLESLAPAAQLVFHNGASDDEYRRTLAAATALVTASRDEGFGIPLVEAMREGTPVVVSDIPIFREIGGEAALYVDPDEPQQIAAAVRQLEQGSEWNERSHLSTQRAAEFSWHSSAQRLLELLRQLTAPGRRSRRPARSRSRSASRSHPH